MIRTVFTTALVIGITLATPQVSQGICPCKKGKIIKPKPQPPNVVTVSAVSDSSISVSSKGGVKTYPINKFAIVRVNGRTSEISDVEVGMRIMVGTNSKGEAQLVSASGAPGNARSKAAPAKTTPSV